jgi:hypothetical protein
VLLAPGVGSSAGFAESRCTGPLTEGEGEAIGTSPPAEAGFPRWTCFSIVSPRRPVIAFNEDPAQLSSVESQLGELDLILGDQL